MKHMIKSVVKEAKENPSELWGSVAIIVAIYASLYIAVSILH